MTRIMANLSALVLLCLLLTACASPQPVQTAPDPPTLEEVSSLIHQQLDAGKSIVEIAPADRQLPASINPAQLGGYFQLGSIDFALAMQPSMNAPLTLPKGHSATFAGVLVSIDGRNWTKYLEIRDEESTDENNPYYLWTDAGDLFLSIVDQTGPGNSKRIMKLEKLSDGADWKLVECYYFGLDSRGPSLDGDYFAFVQEVLKQKRQPLASCQSVNLLDNPD